MSARVTSPEPGGTDPSRVRHAARKMSSVRGPQNPAKIRRKIPVTLSTIMSVSVPDPSPCRTFRHGGACLASPGSNSTTLPAASSGSRASRSVTASPLGSMKTTPRPASASARICPAIRVVLPVPVGPQIRRWCRASGTARPTGRGAPASETPSGRTSGPGTGMAGGGGTARAPARARPGSDGSAGSRAIAASSGTDSRSPFGNHRAAITAAGRRSRRRASQFRPVSRAVAEARAWARPRSRAACCAAAARLSQRPAPSRAWAGAVVATA